MLKKSKSKLYQSITVKVLGIVFLLGSLSLGYFSFSRTAKATDCDQLRRSSYITGYSFTTNKSQDTKVGQNEPWDLYFKGTVPNTPGGDPDWTPCFLSTKYQVNFYSYVYSSANALTLGSPTAVGNVVITELKVKPTPVQGVSVTSYTVEAGAEVTLAKLIPTISSYGPGSNLTYYVYVYAYVCAENKCPTTDFLGFSNFGSQYVGIGDANATTANSATIDKSSFTNNPLIESGLANISTNATGDPNASLAGTLLDAIAQIIGTIIQILTTLIYWLFAFVVAPLIEAVLSIHPYKDIFVQVIYPGWLILRNLSNILFIIVLLIIGLATLFQVERYNYKHLLVKVILAAVMVNFSLVIGQSVLGIADTVQNQFLPDRGNVIRSLGFELMVRPIQSMQLNDKSASGGLSNLTYPFFLFALALGAFFSFVAILVFLVVRIVGLWILLMVSPIAYVARILPNTEKYAEQWWSKFLAYAFITPIFAFFLNIAALFANSHVLSQGSGLYDIAGNAAFSSGVANFVYLTASHITTLVFLMAGLAFAGSTGVVGAKSVTEFVKKGMRKPFTWTGKKLGEYANEQRLNQANKFAPDQNDGRIRSFLKGTAAAAIAPDARLKARAERIKERQDLAAGQVGANAADFSRRGTFGQIKTTKGADFRMRDLKKKGEEALFNPKNGAEVGIKGRKDLDNHKYDDAWGKLINGFNEGNVEDILKRLKMPAGAAGQLQLLEEFKANGMSDNELLALDEAIKSGRKKDLAGSGFGVTKYDDNGKFTVLSRADALEKEREAAAKVGAGEYARNATKDAISRDGVMTPHLAAQLLNTYDKNGKIANGIADERARMQMKPQAKQEIDKVLTDPKNVEKNIEELVAQAKFQFKGMSDADASRLANHIIVNAPDVFQAGKSIDLTNATGRVNTVNNINNTTNTANTTNNNIDNNIRTRIENNVDVKNHISTHAPNSNAAFNREQREFMEGIVKRAANHAVKPLRAGVKVSTEQVAAEIQSQVSQEVRNAIKPIDKLAYERFNVEMLGNKGYDQVANDALREANAEINKT